MRMLPTLAFVLVAAAASAQPVTLKVVPPPPDVAAPPADAVKSTAGLASKILEHGTAAEHPGPTDLVTVNYTGWTTDGKMFDSSVSRGKPATFPLNRVIAGWTEGVQLMVPGEKRRFWIPDSLAYKGAPNKPKGTLVFDVELISFTGNPSIPPPDVKEPPSDAQRTPSGLAYKVLKEGIGGRRPKIDSTVTVHYSGWTTDGKLFDSSVLRGAPTTFALNGVIPGWSEGLQLMVEGEMMRLWIPEKIAYKGTQPPYGQLVFDVELLKIQQ